MAIKYIYESFLGKLVLLRFRLLAAQTRLLRPPPVLAVAKNVSETPRITKIGSGAVWLATFLIFVAGYPSARAHDECTVVAIATELNCTNNTATLTAEASTPGATFLWTGPNVISGANSANAVAGLAGIYTVTATHPVTPTHSVGCVSTASVLVRPAFSPDYAHAVPSGEVDFKVVFSKDSYFALEIINAPPGTIISNGWYQSWCIKYDFPIETDRIYQGVLYNPYTSSLPAHLQGFDWARINYVLNHSVDASLDDIQAAIWYFSGRPEGEPLVLNVIAQALVDDALANGLCFAPQPGDYLAVAIDTGLKNGIQWLLIEVIVPPFASLAVTKECPDGPIPPGGTLIFTGTVTNTGSTTLTNVIVVDDQPAPNTHVIGPLTLLPGQGTNFTGSYVVPFATGLATNVVTTITTELSPVISTNSVTVTATNILSVVTTNLVTDYTTNMVTVPTTNLVTVFVTHTVPVLTTNLVTVLTTNNVPVVETNIVSVSFTNWVTVTVTNETFIVTTNTVASTFGTINTVSEAVVDRFNVPDGLDGLSYADQDKGYAATQFYSMRKDDAGSHFFDTITAGTESVTDRFDAGNRNFDALTFAAPDVGYGPVLFYYLSRNAAGVSTFGSITPGGVVGVVADLFVAGDSFDSLTFAATDVGFGANLFYYVRRDAQGISTFGTINPAQPGTITDRFTVGSDVHALVFTATDVGYGPNNFYYLRQNSIGTTTFGTIAVTGLAAGTVTDRFEVGLNAHELTFTPTDVGFGPNLFYFLRDGETTVTNTVLVISTNTTPEITTENVEITTTNLVAVVTSEVVPVVTTRLVDVITTKIVPVITDEFVTLISTNTVTTLSTNMVPEITTETNLTLMTNIVSVFTTNLLTVISTNTSGIVTDTVTASGFDVQHAVIVTATASCSAVIEGSLIVGGMGVPPVQVQENDFSLSFITVSGASYTVQYRESLSDPEWKDLPNMPLMGTGDTITISDPVEGAQMRFYRVMLNP